MCSGSTQSHHGSTWRAGGHAKKHGSLVSYLGSCEGTNFIFLLALENKLRFSDRPLTDVRWFKF